MGAFDDYVASFGDETGYLNWARFGPLSPAVRAGMHDAGERLGRYDQASRRTVDERAGDATRSAAALLGTDADEVTLHPSSSHGLMQALYGLDGAVVAGFDEFPSISLTLRRAADASHGALRPRWIRPPGGWVTADAVEAALDDEVTAVAVSHVDYRTGYRADLAALRELIGPDRLLIVDAVQSFGVVDEDWSAADVVAVHGYKWLRAGRGAGLARFSARARERIRPVLSGITGIDGHEPSDDTVPLPAASSLAYSTSVPDPLAALRLAAALDEVRRAGVAAIEAAIEARADAILAAADRAGIRSATPRDPRRRAGIVALQPSDAAELAGHLERAGLAVSAHPDSVRVAAHAGTSDATVRMFADAVASFDGTTFIPS